MLTSIVLGAGLSSRMGSANKLLLRFRGKTVLETVVQNITDAGTGEVIVITGHQAAQVEKVLAHLPVRIIYNPNYTKGMTTSIQAGVSAAKGDGYMICLSDMPLITPAEYAMLAAAFNEQKMINEACICLPRYNREKGNPVIFSAYYRTAILNHDEMEGCKEIIQSNYQHIYWVNMLTNHILQDMDNREAYEKMKA